MRVRQARCCRRHLLYSVIRLWRVLVGTSLTSRKARARSAPAPCSAHLIISTGWTWRRGSRRGALSFPFLALLSFRLPSPLRRSFFSLPFDTFKLFLTYLCVPVLTCVTVLALTRLESKARKLGRVILRGLVLPARIALVITSFPNGICLSHILCWRSTHYRNLRLSIAFHLR